MNKAERVALRLAYDALREQPGLREHQVAETHYRYPRWTVEQARVRVEAKRALRRLLGVEQTTMNLGKE